MGKLKSGDLVLNTNKHSNTNIKFAIFLNYGFNAAYQGEKSLSKILLGSKVVQIPTAFLKSI